MSFARDNRKKMDVIKSMKPFVKISQAFGIFPFAIEKSHGFHFLAESLPLLRYSKVLFWILTLAEGGSIVSSNFSLYHAVEISTKLVLLLSTLTLYLSFLFIFRTVVRKRGVLCFWVNQFNNLCLTCPHSPPGNLAKVETFNSALLFFSGLYYVVVILTKLLTTSEYAAGANAVADLVFFARLWIIHLFLKHFVVFVNYIRCFYANVHASLLTGNEDSGFWVKALRELRGKDLFVKDFAKVIQSVYMPVILVQFFWFFVTLLCDITITGRAGMPTLMQVDWMVYIFAEVVLYVSICHVTVNEVELFSLQLQHTRLNFNALGFFTLDYGLLYSMIGATTTYTVILLQFQTNHIVQSQTENASFAIADLVNVKPKN